MLRSNVPRLGTVPSEPDLRMLVCISLPLCPYPSVLSLKSSFEPSAYLRESVFLYPGVSLLLPGSLGYLCKLDLHLFKFWELSYWLSFNAISWCSYFCRLLPVVLSSAHGTDLPAAGYFPQAVSSKWHLPNCCLQFWNGGFWSWELSFLCDVSEHLLTGPLGLRVGQLLVWHTTLQLVHVTWPSEAGSHAAILFLFMYPFLGHKVTYKRKVLHNNS